MSAAAIQPQSVDLPLAAPAPEGNPVRFHLSLNVRSLGAAIEFFRVLLAAEPAKQRSDYAKFEIDAPPLVLSLEPCAAPPGGNLNHLGFRMSSTAELIECQRRLEAAGIQTQREEGVECCYARQTKFWVQDPDANLWEIYTFEGDLDHCGEGQTPEAVFGAGRAQARMSIAPQAPEPPIAAPADALWTHRLGQPLVARLPLLDATVDRAFLQGSFNAAAASDAQLVRQFLAEVVRALKPGAEVELHVLTADRPLAAGQLQLPGPAAVVQHVPVDSVLAAALEAAGLAEIQFTKLGESPCFTALGAELRETRIAAIKPAVEPGEADPSSAKSPWVLYKGPFQSLIDDRGRTFRRGERTPIDRAAWLRLKARGDASLLLGE